MTTILLKLLETINRKILFKIIPIPDILSNLPLDRLTP